MQHGGIIERTAMTQSLRHSEILEIARRDGKVSVAALAAHFGVTLQTIRRDLAEIAETGALDRVHGGAVLPTGTANIRYEERRALHSEAKSAIARTCAARVPQGITLFLNIGTSTEAVARALLNHRDMLVVTNNLNIPAILGPNPDCEVIVTGGGLRRADGGLIGPLATRSIRQFRFDLAVIGCSALDEGGDLLDYDMQEVDVSQAILAQSRQTWLVADASKLRRRAPVRIASLGDLDALFTDAPLPAPLAARCADWATRVEVAPPAATP